MQHARWWIYARWLVVGLPVVLLGLFVGSSLYLVTHSDVFTGSAQMERPAPVARPFAQPLRLTRRVNVLLIGIDITLNNRRQVVPVSRSDTLILVSFDPARDRISGLSIPRDTRAVIPGVGVNKINAAYAFGGPSLTIRTVEDLLDVPIDYYVKLGPQSFEKIIDAIGGVEVDVEKDMKYTDRWAGLYINLRQGRQVLNGQQAMQYIRFRHDALGDIARVERQQKILLALFHKLKSPTTMLAAPQLLRAFTENTQTSLSMTDLLSLGLFTSRLQASDLSFHTLLGTFGTIYWEPDATRIRQTVLEMFYGVNAEMLAQTGVEVLNGSGVPGLARQTADRLGRLGFRIVRVDTAADVGPTTLVIDRGARPEVAQLLAELLGSKPIRHEPGGSPDITVVIGKDLVAQVGALTVSRR